MDLPLPDYLLDILTLKKALTLSTCYFGIVVNQSIAVFCKKEVILVCLKQLFIYSFSASTWSATHSLYILPSSEQCNDRSIQCWCFYFVWELVVIGLPPQPPHSCSCCLYGWLELGLRLTPGRQTQGHSRHIDMPSGRPEMCSECWPGVTNQMMSKAASEWFVALLPQVKWYLGLKWYFPNKWWSFISSCPSS